MKNNTDELLQKSIDHAIRSGIIIDEILKSEGVSVAALHQNKDLTSIFSDPLQSFRKSIFDALSGIEDVLCDLALAKVTYDTLRLGSKQVLNSAPIVEQEKKSFPMMFNRTDRNSEHFAYLNDWMQINEVSNVALKFNMEHNIIGLSQFYDLIREGKQTDVDVVLEPVRISKIYLKGVYRGVAMLFEVKSENIVFVPDKSTHWSIKLDKSTYNVSLDESSLVAFVPTSAGRIASVICDIKKFFTESTTLTVDFALQMHARLRRDVGLLTVNIDDISFLSYGLVVKSSQKPSRLDGLLTMFKTLEPVGFVIEAMRGQSN